MSLQASQWLQGAMEGLAKEVHKEGKRRGGLFEMKRKSVLAEVGKKRKWTGMKGLEGGQNRTREHDPARRA